MTPTPNIQELLDRADRALDTPDRVLITELAQALRKAQATISDLYLKTLEPEESRDELIDENETLRKRLEAQNKFMDDYIGDFWEGCIDPESKFALSCNHKECRQCRLIAWRKLKENGSE